MGKKQLSRLWDRYNENIIFDYTILPEEILNKGHIITYEPESVILLMGDEVEHIYFIKSGTVRGIRQFDNGNDFQYFECTSENGYVGLLELLARKERYAASLTAKTRVEMFQLDIAPVYDYIQNHVEALRAAVYVLARDFYRLSGSTGNYFYKDGLSRVACFLEEYYREHAQAQETVTIFQTYQDIAGKTAVSLRTAGRSIQALKEKGMLSSSRKRLTLSFGQYQKLSAFLNTYIK